ncbi:YLP motif-containing protein 1 isoform X2 [Phalaenopsis equestris]|uniref:YLP motif-containing protein 1 isoform X2 n=1 Tax=Phalaenopsis equestris TaxID=78828 RepID=UPI0009E1E62E|nr:YLP motif-containing protein 1 isoform X2 [Phalaenopsis equestris]
MDDYFMIEVEKDEDNEGLKSSGSFRSKKQITKKVIEYCYEPEMEEAYRSSMLKAFKKTIDDGIFTFVIVDDRNLRVADFAQFWAIAKRSGYEVYVLEATYKDPAGCAARNIHGFKLADIQKMAKQWEEAPPLYLHLNIQSLLGGDDLIDQSMQEVDMDADDTAGDTEARHLQETDDCNLAELKSLDQESDHGSTKLGERWNTDEEEVPSEKNELQKSRWSKELSVDLHDPKSAKGNTNVLSGLIQTYGKGVNFVHWGDKAETIGFSIGANKKQCASSLIIGPGAGYNLKSNPLAEDDAVSEATTGKLSSEIKKRFTEQLHAERESFRAVFDRRRQRVGGLFNADDE